MTNEIVRITLLLCVSAGSGLPLGSQYDGTEYKQATKPYSFAYGIKDSYQGTDIERREISDGNSVIGSYSVQLPDGRKQTVKYKADHRTGFIADVSYYGEAKHPPPSKTPPFVVRVVEQKQSEKVHQSFQPNLKLFHLPEETKRLHSQPTRGNKPPRKSAEATGVAKFEEPHRRPVFHQRKSEELEEQKYNSDFDEDHTIRGQKPETADDEHSTYRSSSSSFTEDENAKDDLARADVRLQTFHTQIEPEKIHSVHWRDPLQTKEARSYFPKYTTPLISQPRKGLSALVERVPFGYDNLEIGRSLYPLRLRGSHSHPYFLLRPPQLHKTISYKRHSNKEESFSSSEQRDGSSQDFNSSGSSNFHFSSDQARNPTSIPLTTNYRLPSSSSDLTSSEFEKPGALLKHLQKLHHLNANHKANTSQEVRKRTAKE